MTPLLKSCPAALLLGLALISAPSAKATLVTFDVQFQSNYGGFGSGSVTLDDTPVGPGVVFPTLTRYSFPIVSGTGDLPSPGKWISASFEYDPIVGTARWDLLLSDPTVPFFFRTADGQIPGLSPIAALETLFDGAASHDILTWSIGTTPPLSSGVPDGGSTLALLGGVMAAITGLRRQLVR